MDFDSGDVRSAALGEHKGNEASAGADVQHLLCVADIGPRAEQHAIGADGVGRPLLLDAKSFEMEGWRVHEGR